MQQQNNWCYCESSTKAHYLAKAFPKQLQKISDLLKSAGAKHSPFKNELAFNMDEIEIQLASNENRARRRTMDMALCVTKPAKSNSQTLLTELKLKVNNEKNIGATELKQKIECSVRILNKNFDNPIHHNYLFVFNERVKQRAQNRIRNLFANKPNYKVLGVNEFYQSYFV